MSRAWTSWLAAALLAVTSLAIGGYSLAYRPELTRGASFLFGDESHNLLVTAVLARGGRLYQDIFSPYGPLSAWSYLWAARLGGNTPRTYEILLLVLNTGALVFMFAGLLRVLTPAWAWLFTLAALVPAMLAPGSLLGALSISPYVATGRFAIAIGIWLWRPPAERTAARSIAIGLAAGICQWGRFGSGAFVVAGTLAADGVAAWAAGDWRTAWRQTGAVLLGAAAAEAALVAWAVTTLPWLVARDVLWPAYYVAIYRWVTPGLRWPGVPSGRLLIGQYGAALAGAACGLWVVARARRSRAAPLVAFVLAAYLVGVLGLFRNVHHFRQYAWLLAAAGAYAAAEFAPRTRAALLVWTAPALAVMLHALVAGPAPGVWRATPDAGPVYLSALASARLDALNALADVSAAHGKGLVAGPHASGWYALFHRETLSRHTWFLQGVVRPWEAARVSGELRSAYAVAICPATDASFDDLLLPADVAAALARTFPRIEQAGGDCVFHLRDDAAPAGVN